MTFNCDWDSNTVLWTIGIGILLIVVVAILIRRLKYSLKEKEHWTSFAYCAIILLLVCVMISGVIRTPQKIVLSDESLKIIRLTNNVDIEYSLIKETRIITNDDIIGEVRNFGSTGYFGDLGKWSSKKLGKYEKFTTNSDKQVFIETIDNQKYMFSCDNPDKLINEVKDRISKR